MHACMHTTQCWNSGPPSPFPVPVRFSLLRWHSFPVRFRPVPSSRQVPSHEQELKKKKQDDDDSDDNNNNDKQEEEEEEETHRQHP